MPEFAEEAQKVSELKAEAVSSPGLTAGGKMRISPFTSSGEGVRCALRACTAAGLLVALVATAPRVARAQFDANFGRVVGSVTGPDGFAIPEVEVSVSSVDTGVLRTVRTDAEGWYQAVSLKPGEYTVAASSEEFAMSVTDGVVVGVGAAVRVDLELALEAIRTTTEVTASLLDAMLPAASNLVAERTFNELPINGRRFHDFALLTPTAQVARASGQLSLGAQRGIYTNVTVDGADYNQSFFGGIQGGERANSAPTVPQSAIQEFQTTTAGFTAEYGRTTSGVVNVSTKSGANELHGDLFYQIRHPRFGLEDPFGAKVLEKLQQFGGSAGGPLQRDRAFWFFAVERQLSLSPRYVEFPALGQSDRERGPEAFDYFKSLEGPFETTNNAWALTPRVDYQFSGGSQLMLRYNYSRSVADNTTSVGESRDPRTTSALSNNGSEGDVIHFLTSQLTTLAGPSVVNRLRFTFTREHRPRIANRRQPTVVSSAVGQFGSNIQLPANSYDARPVVSNNLMWHVGSHDVKLGGELNGVWIDDQFGFFQHGMFEAFSDDPNEVLDVLSPGGSIANRFDAPGIYLRQVGNTLGTQQLAHASLYAQDSWRVTPELTLDLGFRWEGQFNQEPLTGNQALVSRVNDATFPSGALDPSYLADSVRQFMPRLGFAYSPQGMDRRLVVRGSFGIFHAITPPVFFNRPTKAFRETPFDLTVAVVGTPGNSVYQQFLNAGIDLNQYPLGDIPVFPNDDIARVLGGDVYLGSEPHVVHPNFQNPRSLKYSLAVESGLTSNTVAGLQWMYQRTTRLHGLRDFNLPASAVRAGDPAGIRYYDVSNRPAPELGAVVVTESRGRASYQGLTANWKYLGQNLQLVGHYTFARAFNSDINERLFWFPLYTDQGSPDAWGPADLDMRHQVTGHAVARLPGGIVGSAILRMASAPPLDPAAGLDLNGDRHSFDRALQATSHYFGRNSFRNRPMRNLDIRILREFSLSDSRRVEASVELFNALNIDNVEFSGFNTIYGPGLDLSTGAVIGPHDAFQRLRSSNGDYDRNNAQVPGTGPLQVQFGLRFYF